MLLATLEASGVSDDTLVVFHSDHGYSLGEHALWEKFTEFEHGTRVPLIVRAPWRQDWTGLRVSALSSLVDLFPTMMELAGECPRRRVPVECARVSSFPLIRHPASIE